MKILAIDTSCDETAVAITEGLTVLSNTIWSQASLHTKWGGVMPSLAQREHREHIDWVVKKAISQAKLKFSNLDAIAVTIGPGLSIALEVGIKKAKELSNTYKLPLITINHTEAHFLSALAKSKKSGETPNINDYFPAFGIVISGKNTLLLYSYKIGKYKVLAQTVDDALGEALDKAARMIGLGYPGGAILEKMARLGSPKQTRFKLPTPLAGSESRQIFSYSGLKSSLFRLIESEKKSDKEFPSKQEIYDLAAIFQDVAFKHLIRVVSFGIKNNKQKASNLFVGGGVAANTEVRSRLRKLSKENKLTIHFPYSKKLYCDNAAMVGIAAYFKASNNDFAKNINLVDRNPRLKIA